MAETALVVPHRTAQPDRGLYRLAGIIDQPHRQAKLAVHTHRGELPMKAAELRGWDRLQELDLLAQPLKAAKQCVLALRLRLLCAAEASPRQALLMQVLVVAPALRATSVMGSTQQTSVLTFVATERSTKTHG